jgi:hypothetical protein
MISEESIYLSMYNMYLSMLSRIHNTSLISAYFGLDSCECKCLEYV